MKPRDSVPQITHQIYFFYKMLHLIYGKLQSVCVLQDTRYISENNTRFREIGILLT